MGLITIPSRNTKKWIVNFGNDFLGDIIKCFNLDLFSKKGYVKTGQKVYPHTTQDNITGLKTAYAFCKANIDDGDAKEREKKLWAVAENKVLKTEDSDFAFEEDESKGLENDVIGENSDLLSVGDETGSDVQGFTPIETTPVSITGATEGDFTITGGDNTTKFAQSFKATGPLAKITFVAKKVGSPADNLLLKIQEDDGYGSPSGTDLSEYTLSGADLTTSYLDSDDEEIVQEAEIADFNPSNFEFEVEKIYWAVFERSGASDDDNYYVVKIIIGGATDPYESGTLKSYVDSAWKEFTTQETDDYSLATDNNAASGETGWSNAANAQNKTGDAFYATAQPPDGVSYIHIWKDFDFAIPTTAIIKGIEVNVRASHSKDDYGSTSLTIGLTKNADGVAGIQKSRSLSTTISTTTHGDEDDLWGVNWTPAEINSANFGVRLDSTVGPPAGDLQYRCMYMEVKIYYYEEEIEGEEFLDAKIGVYTEFPSAEERLYLTTAKDVKFLGEDNGFWYSLWQGILQKDSLNSDYPAILKNMGAGGVLLLANDNKVHTMIATANTPVEATENRLIFDSIYYVNWAVVTSSSVFLGLRNKESELLPSQIVHYEPYGERTRIFTIEEGATMGFGLNENCHIIDKAGQIRYFTGSAFEPYQYFPCFHRDEKLETLPHRNGIIVKQNIAKILWKGQYPDPAGVWVLENGNLYHKHSVIFDKVNLNSYGALEVEKTGALFEEEDIYLGASLLDENGAEMQGIFSTALEENVSVEADQQAVLATSKFFSAGIKEVWQDLALKYEPVADGEISIKQKKEPARITEGNGATAFNGTWTSDTTFTCSDAEFAYLVASDDIKVGDEVIVRKGQGAGILAHITDITGTTVTIDEGLSDIASGIFTFSVEAWEDITFDAKDTKYSQKASLKDNILEWKQFKIAIKNHALEEIQLVSNADKTLNKK